MARRSEQRRRAVFALYQHDLTGRPLADTLPRDAAPFTRALAQATLDHQPELDALIGHHAEGWALDRIAPLERSILRVALLEMLHPDAAPGEQQIPPEGAIDEAIETAKAYCGSEAPGFVNGILAAVLRARQASAAGSTGTEASRMSGIDPLQHLTEQLEQAAVRLRDGELDPQEAARLVEECARLAGDAATELDRRARAAADDAR